MCGLAGFLDLGRGQSADEMRATAERMADTIRHRGPNDSGIWADPEAGIALGFRRLSILDLSTEGHQPMHAASGRYVLVFNGEIYNFGEIRQELESAGLAPRFRGHSDTEVMLAAFDAWGVEPAIRRLVGMFAFAVWDRHERQLRLARDRMGEKPLYYGLMGNVFLFGSELKALQAHPAFRGEIDREALALYLQSSCFPAPHTVFAGVAKLPPASLLTIDATHADPGAKPRSYWSSAQAAEDGAAQPLTASEEECVDELDRLLRNTVRQEMVADVPLGAFLSGGTDSSLIVALMQAQSSQPVRTFTIGFNEAELNEAVHAKAVAKYLGTDHTELYVTPEMVLDVIPRLPRINDEPFADSSQLPTFLVSQLAVRSVTVSLSGDGGDELFAGYSRYLRAAAVWKIANRIPRVLRRVTSGGLSLLSTRVGGLAFGPLRRVLPGRLRKYAEADKARKFADSLRASSSPEEFYRCLMSKWTTADRLVIGAGNRQFPSSGPKRAGFLQRLQAYDMTTYLPDDILTKVDRASMAVSLEVRAPLLDHRVVEFAYRLPEDLKVRNGKGKWALRRLLDRYIPRQLVERPKMGFVVPISTWLRGPLREWAEALLDESRLRREGFFHPTPIRRKWNEHLSGRRDWQREIWDVLMFQAWQESQQKGA